MSCALSLLWSCSDNVARPASDNAISGDVLLEDWADLELFSMQCGSEGRPEGSLLTIDSNLLHPNGLEGLREITGDLIVLGNFNLKDVNAFPSLARVGGTVRIHRNEALEQLGGLASLQLAGGDLRITVNRIGTLDGLDSLAVVEGAMHISGNANLTDIDALAEHHASGTTSTAAIIVEDNPQLLTSTIREFTLSQVETGFTGTVIVSRNSP